MNTITVVMSTYNGSTKIIKQLDSIFAQEGVDVKCFVRDDGSKDDTLEQLKKYHEKNPNLTFYSGENVGWQRSFLLCLKDAPKADFYAFSDHDDIWFNNKLITGITELKKRNNKTALLFHCNRISCNDKLEPNLVQAPKVPKPLSRENAVTQEYAQGCSIIINEAARNLVCRCMPSNKIPHDFWTGLICYYFGEVIYCNEPLFYHINHGDNASTAGHIRKSQMKRLEFIKTKVLYPNVANDLLTFYSDLLINKPFLIQLRDYKKNILFRLRLLFNPKFRRYNFGGTICLKIALVLGKIG